MLHLDSAVAEVTTSDQRTRSRAPRLDVPSASGRPLSPEATYVKPDPARPCICVPISDPTRPVRSAHTSAHRRPSGLPQACDTAHTGRRRSIVAAPSRPGNPAASGICHDRPCLTAFPAVRYHPRQRGHIVAAAAWRELSHEIPRLFAREGSFVGRRQSQVFNNRCSPDLTRSSDL